MAASHRQLEKKINMRELASGLEPFLRYRGDLRHMILAFMYLVLTWICTGVSLMDRGESRMIILTGL
jgi:hypothetical protein